MLLQGKDGAGDSLSGQVADVVDGVSLGLGGMLGKKD
jgi:hypothetical protein